MRTVPETSKCALHYRKPTVDYILDNGKITAKKNNEQTKKLSETKQSDFLREHGKMPYTNHELRIIMEEEHQNDVNAMQDTHTNQKRNISFYLVV